MIRINKKIFRLSSPKEDRAILLACIGIAFVFWLLIKLSQTYQAEKEIEFEVSTPPDKVLSQKPPANLTAELEGTGWDLMIDYFSSRTLTLFYDMQGLNRLNLSRSQLRSDIKQGLYSDDISILDLNYDNLDLKLEEQEQKKVPVQVRYSIDVAAGFQLKDSLAVSPDSVIITGPKSVVDTHTYWITDSLRLRNLTNTQSRTLALMPPPPEIALSHALADIQIGIEPLTEKSMYVPLVVRNAPDSLRIFPRRVNVTAKVGLSKYDQISYRDFTAEVDLGEAAINTSSNTVPIQIIQKPAYVKSLYFTPKSAKFFIIESKEEEKENPE